MLKKSLEIENEDLNLDSEDQKLVKCHSSKKRCSKQQEDWREKRRKSRMKKVITVVKAR